MTCYRNGGCGPYEMLSCGECPASKKEYLKRYEPEEEVKPSIGDTVFLIVRKRARVTDSEWFSYVKESTVTENNFCRVYHQWGETAFKTRAEAERRMNR